MPEIKIPVATLPKPLEGYGFPEDAGALLPWSHVSGRLAEARNYWVCTVSSKLSRAHARPIWGIWVDETLFFGGGPHTAWSRNLRANPLVSIHLEDGNEAVILEGSASLISDDNLMNRLDDVYEAKYDIRHGPPIWQLHPTQALAWQNMQSVTRFVFD